MLGLRGLKNKLTVEKYVPLNQLYLHYPKAYKHIHKSVVIVYHFRELLK